MATIVDKLVAVQQDAAALLAENAALKDQLDDVPSPPPPPPPPPVPGVIEAPGFGPGPWTVGMSCERKIGKYSNAEAVAGRRYRKGVLIPGATGASYVILAEDVAQPLVYEELARSPNGTEQWFKSAAVVPVAGKPAPPSAGLDVVINDMKLKNDFVLKGYEDRKDGWYVSADVGMSAHPYIDETAIATWNWLYKHPKYWGNACRSALPWAAFFEGVNNRASQTAVELADAAFYLKSKATNKWSRISGPSSVSGMVYPTPNSGMGNRDEEVLSKGNTSSVIKVPPSGQWWHGWSNKSPIDPADVAAVHVTCRARLTGPDLAQAEIGLQVGLDYYVSMDMVYSEAYAPSACISRTKKITGNWQTFTVTSISDVPCQNPGKTGVTMAELRANPPPL